MGTFGGVPALYFCDEDVVFGPECMPGEQNREPLKCSIEEATGEYLEVCKPVRGRMLLDDMSQLVKASTAANAERDDVAKKARSGAAKSQRTLNHSRVEIAACLRFVALNAVDVPHLAIFNVRWIADNDIKAAALHNLVKFDAPVEGLMALAPLLHGCLFSFRNAPRGAGKVNIEACPLLCVERQVMMTAMMSEGFIGLLCAHKAHQRIAAANVEGEGRCERDLVGMPDAGNEREEQA